MGYLHIDNLYKNKDILLFKECYALEKINGTSAHIEMKIVEDKFNIIYFSGGGNYDNFIKLFNKEKLEQQFHACMKNKELMLTIFGEFYGGKIQGMKNIYGDISRFIAFDVKIENMWLNVENAEEMCKAFEIEFVDYVRCSTDIETLNIERDKMSIQAMRNGLGCDKQREGVVLRPLIELRKNNGERIIAKHKTEEFRETKTCRKVGEELKVWNDAKKVAEEFVTDMRLEHILDKIENKCIENMREIIDAMINNVKRECGNEITWNKDVENAIGRKAATLFKHKLNNNI